MNGKGGVSFEIRYIYDPYLAVAGEDIDLTSDLNFGSLLSLIFLLLAVLLLIIVIIIRIMLSRKYKDERLSLNN